MNFKVEFRNSLKKNTSIDILPTIDGTEIQAFEGNLIPVLVDMSQVNAPTDIRIVSSNENTVSVETFVYIPERKECKAILRTIAPTESTEIIISCEDFGITNKTSFFVKVFEDKLIEEINFETKKGEII
jgi:hypothetical protein